MTQTQKTQKIERNEIRLRRIIENLKKLIPNPKIALIYSNPWELFVAVVLSAQTTDKQVNVVTKDLFRKYRSFDDYAKTDVLEFAKDIVRIGLYKGKAKNIIASVNIIKEKYGGRIPDRMEELLSLPGVGRKTANILLSNIYGKQEGIAVDTHVKRLTKLWGLTKENDPNKIEQDLIKLVPRKDWKDFSYLVITYGRGYCPAHCKHIDCPLRRFVAVS